MTNFTTCPNCHGEGTENNPPLRRCGICKGTGRLPSEGPMKHRRAEQIDQAAPSHEACPAGQGG